MSEAFDSQKLKAGEHYGSVFHKWRIPPAFLSESVYHETLDLPEHSHELDFFTLIIDGSYSEVVNSRNVLYRPQTVLWRQAEISHKDKIESESSRFFFVEIDREYSSRLLEHGPIPERLAERSGSLAWLASRLRREILFGPGHSSLVTEGITLEMLGVLIQQGKARETQAPKWLIRVVEKIQDDISENFTNELLAAEAGVHPVHLASVFRRFYDQSIGEYVQKLRVVRASELLEDREIPLSNVAYVCGFSDQSHLTRVFKRHYGITPGAFRNSTRSGSL